MDKINQLLQEYFGITVDQVDSAEGRAALGNYYDRVQSAIATEDPTIIEFIIEEIQVAQGTAGGDGIVSESNVEEIVDNKTKQLFEELGLTSLIQERGYYVYDQETGSLKQITVPSAFPKGFEQLYNITLQPELVASLQNDLIKNGVVKEDYFDDEDEFGAKTANALSIVLDYADKNIFIDKTSEEGQKLIEQYGQGHYGFLQNESDDIIFARAILDLAIQSLGNDVRKQEETQAKLEDEQAMQTIAARYSVPNDIEMEESVSEFIGQYVLREATQKELDRYSTSLAEKYSDRFKQLLALEKAVRTNEIFEDVNKTYEFEGRQVTVPEQQLRTSIFQISDPELEVQTEIKKDLEKEMSVIEKANAARQQQAALIQAMIGQL